MNTVQRICLRFKNCWIKIQSNCEPLDPLTAFNDKVCALVPWPVFFPLGRCYCRCCCFFSFSSCTVVLIVQYFLKKLYTPIVSSSSSDSAHWLSLSHSFSPSTFAKSFQAKLTTNEPTHKTQKTSLSSLEKKRETQPKAEHRKNDGAKMKFISFVVNILDFWLYLNPLTSQS